MVINICYWKGQKRFKLVELVSIPREGQLSQIQDHLKPHWYSKEELEELISPVDN